MKLFKNAGYVAGGIVAFGLIFNFVWSISTQQKVDTAISHKWDSTQRKEVVKIADSVTQSYTNDIYDKQARMYFAQQAMLSDAQKRKADSGYVEFKRNLVHR